MRSDPITCGCTSHTETLSHTHTHTPTHTHTHRSEGGGWRPLMVAFKILVHTLFLSTVHLAEGDEKP